MSTIDDNLPSLAMRHSRWLALWAMFLAVLFSFGWYKSRENQRDQLAIARWNQEQNEFARNFLAELEGVRALIRSLHLRPGSQRELERHLNSGQRFDLHRDGDREVAEWADSIYPFGFRFEFENRILQAFSSNDGNPANFRTREPIWWARAGTAEAWRRQIVWFTGFGWLIAFGAWCAMRTQRLVLSQVLLATALTYCMAALVNPAYTITGNGMLSNDNLGLGGLMLVYTTYLLAVTYAMNSTVEISLSRVRFRLRDLLIAITVVAIMLDAGPLGYVTLLVGLAGAMLFAAVFHYYRSRLGVLLS